MSQDQSDRTRSDDGVIRGEVVPADEHEEPDEAASSSQDRYQQTYLHKVASARPAGSVPDEALAGGAGPVNGNAGPDQALAEDTGATKENTASHDELADAAAASEDTDTDVISENAGDDGVAGDDVTATTPNAVIDGASARDAAAGTTATEAITAAGGPAREQPGRHRADEPTAEADEEEAAARADEPADEQVGSAAETAGAAEAEEAAANVPQARRPGDEPVPPEITGRLLADAAGIRAQWMRLQAQFVDDPRVAVTKAANFLTDVAAQVEAAVRERQQALRGRWDGNGQADTEALRVMMQQYRALLDRLAEL